MIHMCIFWFSISCSVPQRQYSVCFWPFLQFSSGAYCHFWLCCVLSACVLITQDSHRILYSVVFLFWFLCVSIFGVFRVLCGCFEINLCTFLVERPFTQSFPLILLMFCSALCCPAFVALPLSYPLFFFRLLLSKSALKKTLLQCFNPPKKLKNMAEPQPAFYLSEVFFAKGFSGRALAQEWGGGSRGFLSGNCYSFARKTPRQKFSLS